MRPRVVVHNEISLDGRMDRLNVDMARFYRLAASWQEDVTLAGSETVLAAMPELASPSSPDTSGREHPATDGPGSGGETPAPPLLAVVDGRGRVPGLAALRSQPYWRDVVALCSEAAPATHLETLSRDGVDHFVAGTEHVDLVAALEWLADRHGARVIRVDAGGSLVGALLRAALVDEVSVLVEPRLVGGETPRWLVHARDAAEADVTHLQLQHVERFDDGAVWLRYEVKRD